MRYPRCWPDARPEPFAAASASKSCSARKSRSPVDIRRRSVYRSSLLQARSFLSPDCFEIRSITPISSPGCLPLPAAHKVTLFGHPIHAATPLIPAYPPAASRGAGASSSIRSSQHTDRHPPPLTSWSRNFCRFQTYPLAPGGSAFLYAFRCSSIISYLNVNADYARARWHKGFLERSNTHRCYGRKQP